MLTVNETTDHSSSIKLLIQYYSNLLVAISLFVFTLLSIAVLTRLSLGVNPLFFVVQGGSIAVCLYLSTIVFAQIKHQRRLILDDTDIAGSKMLTAQLKYIRLMAVQLFLGVSYSLTIYVGFLFRPLLAAIGYVVGLVILVGFVHLLILMLFAFYTYNVRSCFIKDFGIPAPVPPSTLAMKLLFLYVCAAVFSLMMTLLNFIKLLGQASNPTASWQLEGGIGTMLIVGFGVVTTAVFYLTVLLAKRNSI